MTFTRGSAVLGMSALVLLAGCTAERAEPKKPAPTSKTAKPMPGPLTSGPASGSTKRLGTTKPCELLDGTEAAKIVGKDLSRQTPPETDGPQCFYTFADHDIMTVQVGAPSTRGGTTKQLGELQAVELSYGKEMCSVDLWPKPDDPKQVLGAAGSALPNEGVDPCERARKLVLAAHDKLPG